MGGGIVYLAVLGLGVAIGCALTGGMRGGNRQARNGSYRRMPGAHRRTTPAVRIRAGMPAWDGSDLTDTILPGTMTAIGRTP
jgi:hypothetical protein